MMPTSPPSSKPPPADSENNSHEVNYEIYMEITSSNDKVNTMKQMSDLIMHEPGNLPQSVHKHGTDYTDRPQQF